MASKVINAIAKEMSTKTTNEKTAKCILKEWEFIAFYPSWSTSLFMILRASNKNPAVKSEKNWITPTKLVAKLKFSLGLIKALLKGNMNVKAMMP